MAGSKGLAMTVTVPVSLFTVADRASEMLLAVTPRISSSLARVVGRAAAWSRHP